VAGLTKGEITADVAVVGGGPAGAAAAIVLARAGRDVVLVDKARFPRDKCCGDGLTTGALRRLEALGLLPDSVASWTRVGDVWIRSPSGRTVQFPLPRNGGTFAAVARRRDLDAALLDVARAAGAKVHDGHGLLAARGDQDGVTLEVEGLGPLRAHYVIGADGMWSPLRKALGAGSDVAYLGEWHAFRQYFTNVTRQADSQLWVWFEPDLLPGYAWSFPLGGGRANVGFGVLRVDGQPSHTLKQLWLELLNRPHIRGFLGPHAVAEAPHKAWPIPARIGRTRLVAAAGRVLFVGDAARAADSMTGEGIGQALETGEVAAGAVLAAGPHRPHHAERLYTARVGRTLAVDDRLASALSRVLRSRRGARAAVRVAAASDWTRQNFARWMFEDYPRAILLTPHRWHRGMLHGKGSWLAEGDGVERS
jgi:geranylgeranyl reductase family protein